MLIGLIRNETLKLIRRKRFAVVMGILIAIIGIVTYSQHRILQRSQRREWRVQLQQRVAFMQNQLRRASRNDSSWTRSLRAEVTRLQFYIDHDIDPERPTAPLLVGVLGSDIVSAENAEGTDKLLLTRPVRRWKILTSKLVTLWMFATLTRGCGGLMAFAIPAALLPARGWQAPTFTGFQLSDTGFNAEAVRQLPLWKDTLIAFGLEWFALLCVAAIALLLSVLFKSSAAAIGTMLASLIGGTILTRISPDWTAGKYLFVSALPRAEYYTGNPPPYDGMSMMFCIALLAVWAIGAIAISYAMFIRRDVFG